MKRAENAAPVGPATRSRCCSHGPELVRGASHVRDAQGTIWPVTRPVVALCRCARSARLPWCDGTHQVLPHGWDEDQDCRQG